MNTKERKNVLSRMAKIIKNNVDSNLSLHEAQKITANTFGYRTWEEMAHSSFQIRSTDKKYIASVLGMPTACKIVDNIPNDFWSPIIESSSVWKSKETVTKIFLDAIKTHWDKIDELNRIGLDAEEIKFAEESVIDFLVAQYELHNVTKEKLAQSGFSSVRDMISEVVFGSVVNWNKPDWQEYIINSIIKVKESYGE